MIRRTTLPLTLSFALSVALPLGLLPTWGCVGNNLEDQGGSGGGQSQGSGGAATSGSGGGSMSGSGGAVGGGSGGSVGGGSGGGAVVGSGGGAGSGGASGSGGGMGSGGRGGTGGGRVGSGGVGTGGGLGSGGRAGTGGTTGSGGRAGTGGAGTGGAGTGGAGPTACNVGPATNGNGSFTQYWFSQGTGMEDGGYRLACGYFGTGQGGDGRSDTVQNIASGKNFAAIPARSRSDFNSVGYCGACAEVTGQNGARVIVTIVDMCPEDSNMPCRNNPSGHLDLSVTTMDGLGFPRRDPSNTSWRFVPCPVTGNVIVRIKKGNQNELFVENMRVPIRSVEWNGTQATRTAYGAWHYNDNLAAGSMLRITDTSNRVITYTLVHANQNVNQDTGLQFPQCL